MLWCLSPFIWAIFMVGDLGAGQGAPPPAPQRPAGNDDFVAKLLGSVLMIAAFLYGLWCSVGVIMGLGLDRAVTVVEQLFSFDLGGKELVAATQKQPSASDDPEIIPCP